MKVIFSILVFVFLNISLYGQSEYRKRFNSFDLNYYYDPINRAHHNLLIKFGFKANKIGLGISQSESVGVLFRFSYDRLIYSQKRYEVFANLLYDRTKITTNYQYWEDPKYNIFSNVYFRGGISYYLTKRMYIQGSGGIGYGYKKISEVKYHNDVYTIGLGLGVRLGKVNYF